MQTLICIGPSRANHVKIKHKLTRLTKIQRNPYYSGLELWDKFFFLLFVCFTRYLVFRIAVLPHRPG